MLNDLQTADWDRGPDPAKAKQLRRVRLRLERAWVRAERLMDRGPRHGQYFVHLYTLGPLYLQIQYLNREIKHLELQ